MIADFVSNRKTRIDFNANIIIWMDNRKGRFEDTNKIVPPKKFNFRIKKKNGEMRRKLRRK